MKLITIIIFIIVCSSIKTQRYRCHKKLIVTAILLQLSLLLIIGSLQSQSQYYKLIIILSIHQDRPGTTSIQDSLLSVKDKQN